MSLYCAAYSTKYSSENDKELTAVLEKLNIYMKKTKEKQKNLNEKTTRSKASIGFGLMFSGSRAMGNSNTKGSPGAAFICLRNRLYNSSHKSTRIPLEQARAFLCGEFVSVSITTRGSIMASIYHYFYRSRSPEIDCMNYYEFSRSQEIYELNRRGENHSGEVT